MWFLYNVLFFVFALLYLPAFFLKGKFGPGAGARFGSVPESARNAFSGRTVIWVHAVSVGEIGLAVSFVNRLRDRLPEARFLITTTTVAGYNVGQKIKNEEDTVLYFPIDFPWAVRRFFGAVQPSALFLLETEIWPNLLREAAHRGVPVLLLNGRISDRAFDRYLGGRFFLKKVFRFIEGVSAQDERMKARFAAIGADASRIAVNGNLKYDWEPSAAQEKVAEPLKRALAPHTAHLAVAGSTHEGEEEILFRVHASLRKKFPHFRLLIAPRHLDRLDAIEKTAEKLGVKTARVSSASHAALSRHAAGEVWLLDQLGALAPLYESARVTFVGGSLVPVGGHNLIEPAFYAKPVAFGPHMNNFSEMAREFEECRAGLRVADDRALETAWEELLSDAEKSEALGRAARQLVRRHQGATQKSLDWALNFLNSNERSFVKV